MILEANHHFKAFRATKKSYLNLASNEYFSVDVTLKVPVIMIWLG
jgi:hypothetical protein